MARTVRSLIYPCDVDQSQRVGRAGGLQNIPCFIGFSANQSDQRVPTILPRFHVARASSGHWAASSTGPGHPADTLAAIRRISHTAAKSISSSAMFCFPRRNVASPQVLKSFGERFDVPVIRERIFGQDYAKTLAIWRKQFPHGMVALDRLVLPAFVD